MLKGRVCQLKNGKINDATQGKTFSETLEGKKEMSDNGHNSINPSGKK